MDIIPWQVRLQQFSENVMQLQRGIHKDSQRQTAMPGWMQLCSKLQQAIQYCKELELELDILCSTTTHEL